MTTTKDLRGPIVSSVRKVGGGKAGRSHDDEELTPLVRLGALDASKPVLGRLTIRAEPSAFVLEASRSGHGGAVQALTSALSADKQAYLERRGAAERELRRAVASLAAAKRCQALADKNPARGGEIDLFSCAFAYVPRRSEPAEDER